MPYDPKIGPGNPFLVDEAKGLVYQIDSQGQRFYYPPNSISPESLGESQRGEDRTPEDIARDEARAREMGMSQGGGLFTKRKAWDPESATYKGGIDWPMLLTTIGAGGILAAPAIAGLAGAGAGGGAASGAAGAGGASAGGAAATGAGALLPSTAIGSGLSTLPAGLASGAVSGGLATGVAAPGAAAAFGGGGMNWAGLAQKAFDYKNPQSYMDLADRFGAVSQGRAQGRQAEAMNQMALARLLLGQAEFNRGAPGARGRNAVFGDLLSGLQPAKLSGEGRNLSVGGGLTPALLSPETRQLGSSIRRQALLSQLGQGGADDVYTFNQKTAAPMPEEGTLDKILSYAGLAGGLLGGGGR